MAERIPTLENVRARIEEVRARIRGRIEEVRARVRGGEGGVAGGQFPIIEQARKRIEEIRARVRGGRGAELPIVEQVRKRIAEIREKGLLARRPAEERAEVPLRKGEIEPPERIPPKPRRAGAISA